MPRFFEMSFSQIEMFLLFNGIEAEKDWEANGSYNMPTWKIERWELVLSLESLIVWRDGHLYREVPHDRIGGFLNCFFLD